MERLQKVMARAGVASRRKSEEWILSGKVRVNGKTVTQLGTRVDPERDRIEVEGRLIRPEQKRYFLFYKPKGVITSLSDPDGRPVVTDWFREVEERVYPVGRLDYDTEGLLLLTNDGELTHGLAHPRHEVDKVYQATVKGIPAKKSLRRLETGVKLTDGWTAPAKVRMLRSGKEQACLELTIHEGRNRQVRRMCEAVGHPVVHLVRVQLAFLTLSGLQPGEYRELSKEEIRRLKELL
ncbi:pseudouridine synthase [Kroppenstedtia eburnea]|uniref:Pseudouridine synthase n=1 Tax=Kroppenstedtia eburnea TaxID=714067 RepID=A0A1N7INS3_9BACL|nr:pseudouridine synthase [Kroppenstedtia eburnea]EGK14123.1 ribosomal large subunit pseudouridine synthase B [Desmospora sp. 8437]QKI82020.1 rRNA pseudouridine synthase [Kroppenstedtia eburnea]SIS38753.1 23S rRNA pseudouridine2605 synthase [Kroppenstedtia eburnea]